MGGSGGWFTVAADMLFALLWKPQIWRGLGMRQGGFGAALSWTAWVVMTLLAVAVGLASLRYLSFNPLAAGEEIRPNLLNHPIPFYIHVFLAPPALLIGAWQFLPFTRRSKLHRYAGRAYVAFCLGSAIAGFIAAFTTAAGPATGGGFAVLAVLWFGATMLAFLAARQRQFALHRKWMIRSYALTAAAITLRLILGGGVALGMEFGDVYLVSAWASWIINLVLAEVIIRWPERRTSGAHAFAGPSGA